MDVPESVQQLWQQLWRPEPPAWLQLDSSETFQRTSGRRGVDVLSEIQRMSALYKFP